MLHLNLAFDRQPRGFLRLKMGPALDPVNRPVYTRKHFPLPPPKNDYERFLRGIEVSTSLSYNGTPCWLWVRGTYQTGYGCIMMRGVTLNVARLAWVWEHGKQIPDGLTIDHLCKVRTCCNPKHLEAVTNAENVSRAHKGTHRVYCRNGHKYTPKTTYIWRGERVCHICRLESQRRARKRRRSLTGMSPTKLTK